MSQLLEINGVPIKRPSSLSFSRYNLTKAGRTASGKMTMDLVAKKRKFNFEYAVIASHHMEVILGLIDSDEMFFTLKYTENGKTKSAVVYVGEIGQDRFRVEDKTTKVWYWKNFNFNLIEQ